MIDHYKILTLTFSDARLEELSDYLIADSPETGEVTALQSLKMELGVEELYYLHTCNRVLYLFYSPKSLSDIHHGLIGYLRRQAPDSKINFGLKKYAGDDAVQHFFEVASSLQSMVVGEHEILRQVREAYEKCWQNGLAGDQIRILFQSALQTAKAVHNKTRISEKAVSVVSLAMKKLRRLGIHPQDEVILIGAGDTMQKVGRFLQEWKMEKVKIFNRSWENLHLMQQILPGAEIHLLEELPDHDLNVPFIITCTSHPDFILTSEIIDSSTGGKGMAGCRGILDLAVPRDVHPEVITDYGLKVIEVESLRTVAEKNKDFRKKEMLLAGKIISAELESFREKVHRRFIERAFRDVPSRVYATRDKALNEVYKDQIENLDPQSQDLIREIVNYMADKCISIPMQTARKQYIAIRKAQSMSTKQSDQYKKD